MTLTVDSLLKAGLIDRKENPDDLRQWLIGLSKNGHSLLASILPKVEKIQEEFLVCLSKKDLKKFNENLVCLLEHQPPFEFK